jgi:MFS family permease
VRPPPLILLLCLLIFTNTVPIGAFPALLPEIGRAGALPDWQLGAVAAAFGFARTVADIPVGVFITHHLRRALVLSPVLLAGGVFLLGSGGPLPVLVAARAVMGVAHALGLVAGLTAILRYQATGRLGSALSAFELSAMLGILGATLIIGLLPTSLPWNLAFLLTCAPQLLGLALIPAVLAALPAEATGARGWFPRRRAGAEGAPITRGVVLAFAAGGVIAVAYATLEQFVIPLRGDREFALSRSGIAGLLVTLQVCDIVCLLPAGALADRHGASRVLGLMLLLFGVGVALVAFGDFTALLAGCALVGIAMAAWTLPLSLLRGETPSEQIGWRTAVYRVGVDGGIFLGPFLSGLLTGRAPWLLPGVLVVLLLVIGAVLVRRSLPTAGRRDVATERR